MKCQSCQARAATVHYTEISDNKESREIHLCEECYAKQKPGSTDLLGLVSGALAAPAPAAEEATGQACAQCGLTYAAFRNRGRLGCPACYDAFRASLEGLLERIHGAVQHRGKSPFEGAREDRSRERQVVALRRRLQDAIREENFELAARLRDELRRAEAGTGAGTAAGTGAGADA